MKSEEFVTLIKSEVSQAAIDDTLANLNEPPGRSPKKELADLSEWYKALPETDRAMIEQLISESVHESVFGFLCVLDGVRSISQSGEENGFELYHQGSRVRSDEGQDFHDLYNDA